MIVYRIENASTGKGICEVMGSKLCPIYRKAAERGMEETEHCTMPCKAEQCKSWIADVGHDKAHMRYAFPTMDALRNWFPSVKGRQAMVAAGARGQLFEVPELVAKGPFQVIFDMRLASPMGEFDITEDGPTLNAPRKPRALPAHIDQLLRELQAIGLDPKTLGFED